MSKTVVNFITSLLIVLGIAFVLHLLVLNQLDFELFNNKIVLSYSVNAILAIAILTGLFKLKERYKTQIGFLFLFGSALKFLVFFLVFYPYYKADGIMDKQEFAAFFLPYALCLILETIYLSKMLNKMA